ncbi:hypothetical protein OSB04_010881 [Centaurea solstitialis]|uniref:MULE transposase domain-containing protein n=1 Tax=Centaurea solstitialis TaxID=347529 RepID=A0AA38WCE0_9ASTR|nr:hypothetical protein OSB04_010881 [Centaurea solstitialis]
MFGRMTRCRIHFTKDRKQYEVYHFVDRHNHPLLHIADKRLLRINRQLKYTDYIRDGQISPIRLVTDVARLEWEPSRVSNPRRWRLDDQYAGDDSRRSDAESADSFLVNQTSFTFHFGDVISNPTYLKGGYKYIGATFVDYQNARRDVGSFVGNKDAKMFVNLLEKRTRTIPKYFVEYKCCIFWADEICLLNYKEFGDSISIDGTFRTNRYVAFLFSQYFYACYAVFFPFTAIDNHKKFVIVGSALICNKKIKKHEWVLSAFLKAHGKKPLFVMTDKCPTLKQVTDITESNHRLCIWHIMKNMHGRVCVIKSMCFFHSSDFTMRIYIFKRQLNFPKNIHKFVWDVNIEPEVFNSCWHDIIDEFQLHSNGWMRHMFDIRDSWIPVYYKTYQMSGLM